MSIKWQNAYKVPSAQSEMHSVQTMISSSCDYKPISFLTEEKKSRNTICSEVISSLSKVPRTTFK